MKKINRRQFLKIASVGAPVLIGGATQIVLGINKPSSASAAFPAPDMYIPLVTQKGPGYVPPTPGSNIIADHTVVDRYQDIPQEYKNQVKKMWANIPGESHSFAYRRGCQLLQALDSSFPVNITKSVPDPYSDQFLRINRVTWGDVAHESGWLAYYGEEDWFTSELAVQRTKNHISYCNENNLEIAAIGFAWCWDMLGYIGGGIDPDHKVRWGGLSLEGPDGSRPWGLDAGDVTLTGNNVCMDTYLNATLEYMNHCQSNGYPTKVFFTTGPVDRIDLSTGESGYQREIKHEYMRSFVQQASDRILFDYADILCWSDAGQQNMVNWTDHGGTTHTFPFIHNDNMRDLNGATSDATGHIAERGALRLGKALWWMLARIAGWDGN